MGAPNRGPPPKRSKNSLNWGGIWSCGTPSAVGVALPSVETCTTAGCTAFTTGAKLPGLPTINELGYPGYVVNFGCVVAPAGLPADIRDRMSRAINEITTESGFVDLVTGRLGATPMQINAAELGSMIRDQAVSFKALKTELEK